MNFLERRRIRLDEEANGRAKRVFTLWNFANTSFGLWFLSAVVFSGLTAIYSNWKVSDVRERQRAEEIQKLDLEIGYRLSKILLVTRGFYELMIEHDRKVRQIDGDKTSRDINRSFGKVVTTRGLLTDKQKQDLQSEIDDLSKEIFTQDHPLVALSRATSDKIPPLYPEYAPMNLLGLLAELQRIASPDSREIIGAVIVKLTRHPFDVRLSRFARGGENVCLLAKLVLNDLVLDRWKSGPFVNLRCKKDDPFCDEYVDPKSGKTAQYSHADCNPSSH